MGGIRKAVGSIMDGKALSGIGTGAIVGGGLNAYFGIDTYHTAREEGSGMVGAAARGIGEMVVADVIGMPMYIGALAATGLPKAIYSGVNAVNAQARTMTMNNMNKNMPFGGVKPFQDTQQAYTMRQAGMQLAQSSKYNLQQSMLGNEASYMHI